MMTLSSRAVAATFLSLFPVGFLCVFFASFCLVGFVCGDALAPPTPAAKTKPPAVHSAASMECSKEADAKGLHGKERKKFRSECKKTAADKPK